MAQSEREPGAYHVRLVGEHGWIIAYWTRSKWFKFGNRFSVDDEGVAEIGPRIPDHKPPRRIGFYWAVVGMSGHPSMRTIAFWNGTYFQVVGSEHRYYDDASFSEIGDKPILLDLA